MDLPESPREYITDVIGETRESADDYQVRMQFELQRLLDLPDEHAVEVISGRRDAICDIMDTGEHCIFMHKYGSGGKTRIARHPYDRILVILVIFVQELL